MAYKVKRLIKKLWDEDWSVRSSTAESLKKINNF